MIAIDRLTRSWTSRRWVGVLGLALIGVLSGGLPAGSHAGGWAVAGLITAAALVVAYVTLLRFDPTLVPLALGTTAAMRGLSLAIQRPFPAALAGGLLAAIVAAVVSYWWFRLLRMVYSSVPANTGPNN